MSGSVWTAAVVSVVAVALTTGAAAAGGAAVQPAAPTGNGTVKLLECVQGKRARDRRALYRGQMRALTEAPIMRMRFKLSERVGREPWRAVGAPGLGVWHEGRPVRKFAYRQRIAGLRPGTAYRVDVDFQWRQPSGGVYVRQTVRSPVCRQRGKLPNLQVAAIERQPGPTPETVRYVATIRNAGPWAARRVAVALRIDGADIDRRQIAYIPARDSRQVGFVGPACKQRLEIRADPDDEVRELVERDNVRSLVCG